MSVSLMVLCGLPASGKTTLAHHLSERFRVDEKVTCVLVISYDELMPQDVEITVLESKTPQAAWKIYRNNIFQCVESLVQYITENGSILIPQLQIPPHIDVELRKRFLDFLTRCLPPTSCCDHVIVIIDDNMYYRSMRYDYYQMARKYHTSFSQVHVSCHLALALERNHLRQCPVPEGVIENMIAKMEAPDSESHAWEKFSVRVTSEKTSVEAVVSLFEAARLEPVPPISEEDGEKRNESRRCCSESSVHQADQILRKLISQKMFSLKDKRICKSEMKGYANHLNRTRSNILDGMKVGVILLPIDMEEISDSSKNKNSDLFRFVEEIFQDEIKEVVL